MIFVYWKVVFLSFFPNAGLLQQLMILILSDLTEVSLVFEQEESLKVVLIETAVKKGEKKCP